LTDCTGRSSDGNPNHKASFSAGPIASPANTKLKQSACRMMPRAASPGGQCISLALVLLCVATLSSPQLVTVEPTRPLGLYFLHMRKCGGSSVGAYLRSWLAAMGCCPPHAPCKPAPGFMASADDATWNCRGMGGNATIHFREDEYHCLGASFLDAAAPAAGLRGPTLLSVVVVRHPIDRYISQWWLVCKKGKVCWAPRGPGSASRILRVRCARAAGTMEAPGSAACNRPWPTPAG